MSESPVPLKLRVVAACVVGAVAAYRLLFHPLIESAFSLNERASSIRHRVNILVVLVLSYWAFARYYERRAGHELSLQRRW